MENKIVNGILGIVEDKLREFGIQIPDPDREGSSDPIVGYQYAELHDRIQEYLEEEGLLNDRSFDFTPQKNVSVEPVDIKVIMYNGLVDEVLKNQDTPIRVEVVPVDTDYEDYEQLCDYRTSLYNDPSYIKCDFSTANFEDELSAKELIDRARITDQTNAQLTFDIIDDKEVVCVDISYDGSEDGTECLYQEVSNEQTIEEAGKLLNDIAKDYGFPAYDEYMDSLTHFPVKVEWFNLDEGYNGDYDPKDPEDEKLLRFDVSVWRDGNWEVEENGSHCTQFPASASKSEQREALYFLMDNFYPVLSEDPECSIKKLAEEMSWISLDTLSSPKTLQPTLEQRISDASEQKCVQLTGDPSKDFTIEH